MIHRWTMKRSVLLLASILAFPEPVAFGQANSELTGIVTDQTGAVIAGARIVLVDPANGISKTSRSGSAGLYDVSGLNPAKYNLKVMASGFESFVQNAISVNVSSTTRVDVKLTVGSESQTITVEANALTIQTDSNVISTLISSDQISEIATENRNFAALAALGLGVSSVLPDSNTPTAASASFTISVNGLRQSHNIWLIDGGEADDRGGGGGMDIMPSQDAIAEFSVMASNYPPDYGISSGATMSLSLKSGTQRFHGEAWEFNRNTDYDANQYFNKLSTPFTPRTSTHYDIYGFNLGGPVYIPRTYNINKQKTFFFWNEEWRKLLSGAGTNEEPTIDVADIPTAATDLTYVPPAFASVGLVVPTVSDPAFNVKLARLGLTPGYSFPGNKIPHQLFDPNGVLYLNSGILPKANTSFDYNITNLSYPTNARDDVIRIDHKFNDKWTILGHYMHDKVIQGSASPELGWAGASYNTVTSTLSNPSNSAALKLSGILTPTLLVEASINYDGNIINIVNSSNAKKPASWSLRPFFDNGNPYLPGIGWGDPYYVGEDMGSAPWHNAAEDYEPKVDVSFSTGKHAMKYGWSYNRYTKNQQLFGDTEGYFSFGSLTNDSFMDMLLGLSSYYSQFQATPIRHYVNETLSGYAMDNWHLTPRLSLQLGLRYDALPHAWERNNDVANFSPNAYVSSQKPQWNDDGSINPSGPGFQTVKGVSFYLNGMGLAGQNGFPKGLVANDYRTYQPRLGFSEDLFGDGKTVLRCGFGTFFERLQGNDIYNAAASPPFAFDPGAANVYLSTPRTSWVTGLAAETPIYASGISSLATDYRAPAVAQFSLAVQHELTSSVIWVVQYVGNIAWHQSITRQINNFPLNTPPKIRCDAGDGSNHYGADNCTSLSNPNIYAAYQGYAGINQQENTTNGNYNGLQTGVRVQNKYGLSGEFDYTWSHEIDLTSFDLFPISNPWNLKYDKGSGALDRRQMLNASYIYKLPFFAKGRLLTRSVLSGWEIAGTAVFESGVTQEPGLSISYDPVGLNLGYTNRPNVAGKLRYPKTFSNWFNTVQFSAPIPSWAGGPNQGFGNAGKDSIVGPRRVNFTTSLYKSFAVTGRAHFELRLESFNTFNHTEFSGVSTSLGSGKFGQVNSAWDNRVIELAGKFVF